MATVARRVETMSAVGGLGGSLRGMGRTVNSIGRHVSVDSIGRHVSVDPSGRHVSVDPIGRSVP